MTTDRAPDLPPRRLAYAVRRSKKPQPRWRIEHGLRDGGPPYFTMCSQDAEPAAGDFDGSGVWACKRCVANIAAIEFEQRRRSPGTTPPSMKPDDPTAPSLPEEGGRRRCSLCGSFRLPTGACSFLECKDPLYDHRQEEERRLQAFMLLPKAPPELDVELDEPVPASPPADDRTGEQILREARERPVPEPDLYARPERQQEQGAPRSPSVSAEERSAMAASYVAHNVYPCQFPLYAMGGGLSTCTPCDECREAAGLILSFMRGAEAAAEARRDAQWREAVRKADAECRRISLDGDAPCCSGCAPLRALLGAAEPTPDRGGA